MSTPHPVIASIVEGYGEERTLLGLCSGSFSASLPGAYATAHT
ncbi:hypothetical protein [Streptomyces mirabilis]